MINGNTREEEKASSIHDEMMRISIPKIEAKIRPKFEKSPSQKERESFAVIFDHGRHHFPSIRLTPTEEDDPFHFVFTLVKRIQELAIPLFVGVLAALILANTVPETYKYYFASDRCENDDDDDEGDRRYLSSSSSGCKDDDDDDDHGVCHEDRFLLSDLPLFGHQFTLHFLANDIIMALFFGLAIKEVVEAALPGGSLNPPSKAMNPILTTIGGVLGPVIVYIALLKLFISAGVFDPELDRGLHYSDLIQGWGVVTATDIVLAWLVGRVVFGDGHPAIDFLLLLAVADDAIGIAIIAIFYPDPDNPVRPAYLTIVFGAMGMAYALRKWHFRRERRTRQPWQPYIFFTGVISWIGLIESHLHPALALVFVVPFMPATDHETKLKQQKEKKKNDDHEMYDIEGEKCKRHVDEWETLAYRAHRDGGTILAGLFGAKRLLGHRHAHVKVAGYNEDGEEHLHVSTLDSFERFWKIYVDFGVGLFALCNAGVQIEGVGGMTYLVLISLVVGKYGGILLMYKFSKWLGFLPPLGVRTRHIRMVGLLASMGLTVALFVCDVAFTDLKLQGEAKLGALLSGLVGVVAYALSKFF
mmetsp:Transcript_3852/g.5085  ORF Transcript_3852/g.5085 Transcript_3852/m.5085 type:complete len:586 (+) Transcript_3852:87-1844(+)